MPTVAERRRKRQRANAIQRQRVVADEIANRPGVIQLADMAVEAKRRPHQARKQSSQIDYLAKINAISESQFVAAKRFHSDWHRSGLNAWATKPDNAITGTSRAMPGCGPTYAEYMQAYKMLGPLGSVVAAVACHDQSPAEWARERGEDRKAGVACLRLGLNTLIEHYHPKA